MRLGNLWTCLGAGIVCLVLLSGGQAAADVGWGFDDIANLADRKSRLREAADAGRKAREVEIARISANGSTFVLPPNSPAYAEIAQTFRELEAARAAILDRADQGTNYFQAVREAVADRELQVTIVQSAGTVATAYPDTSLLISRSLLDNLSDDPGRALWSRRFTLAHELVHLRDAHPVLNWVAVQGRARSANAQVAAGIFNFVSDALSEGGPDLGNINVSNDGSTYATLAENHGFFEFLADFWAFYILKEMKAPAGVSLAALQDVAARQGVAGAAPSGITLAFLPERIACMTRLDVAEPTTATDDAYWACALTAARAPRNVYFDRFMEQRDNEYERERDRQMDDAGPGMMPMYDTSRRARWQEEWTKYREPEVLRAAGSSRNTVNATVIDGIPLTSAGDGFRSTRALPDLVIEHVRVSTSPMAFTQEQAALIEVRVKNVGRRPVTAPYALALAPRPGVSAPCPTSGLCNTNPAPPWDIAVAKTMDLRLYAPAEALAAAKSSPDWGVMVIHCAAGAAGCERPEQDATNNWMSLAPPPVAQPGG